MLQQCLQFILNRLLMKSKWEWETLSWRFEEQRGRLDLDGMDLIFTDIPEIVRELKRIQDRIEILNIPFNNIGAAGAKHLSAANFTRLRELYIWWNNIGPTGVKHLLAANFTKLQFLDLYANNIGDEGAKQLVAGNFPNLIGLNLSSRRGKVFINLQLSKIERNIITGEQYQIERIYMPEISIQAKEYLYNY